MCLLFDALSAEPSVSNQGAMDRACVSRREFTQALVSVLGYALKRALNPAPQAVMEEAPGLFHSEVERANELGANMEELHKLNFEIDLLEKEANVKRRRVERLEADCVKGSKQLMDTQEMILQEMADHRKGIGSYGPDPVRADTASEAESI